MLFLRVERKHPFSYELERDFSFALALQGNPENLPGRGVLSYQDALLSLEVGLRVTLAPKELRGNGGSGELAILGILQWLQ